MLSTVEILQLFFYRRNPFALKTSTGYIPIYQDVNLKEIREHLDYDKTIGVYQSREDETCMWACIDFDKEEYKEVAIEITSYYSRTKDERFLKDVKLEKSNSKGYHVWFFLSQPIKTEEAYNFLICVLNRFKLTKGNKIDIFPRSPHLSGKQVGWMVKVPRTFEVL